MEVGSARLGGEYSLVQGLEEARVELIGRLPSLPVYSISRQGQMTLQESGQILLSAPFLFNIIGAVLVGISSLSVRVSILLVI